MHLTTRSIDEPFRSRTRLMFSSLLRLRPDPPFRQLARAVGAELAAEIEDVPTRTAEERIVPAPRYWAVAWARPVPRSARRRGRR